MNSPVNISPTFIFLTFPGLLGRHSPWKMPSSGCHFGRCFPKVSSFSPGFVDLSVQLTIRPTVGISKEPTTWCCSLASTKQVPQLCQVTGVLPFQGLEHPHIRADKIQQDQILGCFGPSKIVKVILMFEQPFNDPMVWLRASRIRLRFEMAWVLKGLHSCKAFWYSKTLGDVDPSPQIACHVSLAPQPDIPH